MPVGAQFGVGSWEFGVRKRKETQVHNMLCPGCMVGVGRRPALLAVGADPSVRPASVIKLFL
jgi:hypothetical protein